MSQQYWILVIAVAVGGLVIGWLIGRYTAPQHRRRKELEAELQTKRGELDAVRGQVNDHFGESARLFANLAGNYRALYQHFATSAREMGLSERETQRLLEPAEGKLTPTREENTQETAAARQPVAANDADEERSQGDRRGAESAGQPAETSAAAGHAQEQSTAAESGDQPAEASEAKPARDSAADTADAPNEEPEEQHPGKASQDNADAPANATDSQHKTGR